MLDRDVLVTWVETAQAATNISIKPVMEILNAQRLRIIVVSPSVLPSHIHRDRYVQLKTRK